MATTSPREFSARTYNLIFVGIVAAMIITVLFSLVGVAFGILFMAIHLIAPGVMMFIASLLSSVFTTLQAVTLRLEVISVDHRNGKLSLLQTICSIALPSVIACWIAALAVDLGANRAFEIGHSNGAIQNTALAVVSICFFTSIVLFCLVKVRHHLLDPASRSKKEIILPYTNQYQFGADTSHMRQIQQPATSGHPSIFASRSSNHILSGYVSPSCESVISALGIYQQQTTALASHGRSRSKPSSPMTALPPIRPIQPNERSTRSSEGKTASVPNLQKSLSDRKRPSRPMWTYLPPTIKIPPPTQPKPYQHRDQCGHPSQTQTMNNMEPQKPTTHREHLLRKLSGINRRSSKTSTARKIRMIPSSPTLGDAHHNKFQSMTGGREVYGSKGSQDTKRNTYAAGDAIATPFFDSQAIGTAITLDRSSSSSSVPRQRSPLSLVQIAEEDDSVAPLPQLMPGLESRNLSRISMVYPDDCAGGVVDPTPRVTLVKPKKNTELATTKKTQPGNDRTHRRDDLGPSFKAFVDDGRFNDAEDDAALQPAPITTSPLMMHPVPRAKDMPSPLLIVKKLRSTTASAATSISNFGKSSHIGRSFDDSFSDSSRPSTAATMGDTMLGDSPPFPSPPVPPTWQQHSLVKKHERIYQQLKAHKGAKLVSVNGKQRTVVPQEDLWRGFEAGADFEEAQAASGANEETETEHNKSDVWESGSGGVAVLGDGDYGRDGAQNRIMDSGDSADGGVAMSSNASRGTVVAV